MIRIEINPPSKHMTRSFAEFDLSALSTVSKRRVRENIETGIIKGCGKAADIAQYILDSHKLPFVRLHGIQPSRARNLCIRFYHYPIKEYHERITKYILLSLGILFPGERFTDTYYNVHNTLYYISRSGLIVPSHICDHVWEYTDYNPKTDPTRLRLVDAVKADMIFKPT